MTSADLPADPFHLQRFVAAIATVAKQVQAELAQGSKRSHWMWFVFPQLKALGRSATAQHFGMASAEEALAYWRHPVLGSLLLQHTKLVCALSPQRTAHQIFGLPDELKFRSCMTLFGRVVPEQPVFQQALDQFCGAKPDARTLALLDGG